MHKNYSLYGVHGDEIEPIVKRLEKLFGIKMEERDSIVWGDYFLSTNGQPNQFSVYWNEEPEDGGPQEPEFEEYEFLLSIYESTNMPEYDRILSEDPIISATFLERNVY